MIPSLVRLPAAVLGEGSLAPLAACADAIGEGRVVLVGTQRTEQGHELDAFVVAASVAVYAHVEVGVSVRVGAGRAASIIAREATAAQLVGACHALLLEGDASSCRDAATVIATLFVGGVHTVVTRTERTDGARNNAAPEPGQVPGIFWREHDEVWRQTAEGPQRCGDVLEVPSASSIPAPVPGALVLLAHPVASAADLAASLSR